MTLGFFVEIQFVDIGKFTARMLCSWKELAHGKIR